MKQTIFKFMLFVYLNRIKEDWDDYNSFGKILIYPLWFFYSCFIWIVSPIFIPQYLFQNSNFYKKFKELSPEQIAMVQKQYGSNFITPRYSNRKKK